MLKIEFAQDQFFDAIAGNILTFELLSHFVSQGHSLEALTENGDTVFHVAAQHGATQSLVAIIDCMKATAVAEKTSKTPWGWLANKYYSDDPDLPPLALALLKTTNKQGATPLHLAAMGGFDDSVRLLVSKADIHGYKDSEHRTPLICAAQNGHQSTVALLAEKSAQLHVKSFVIAQPIHWAASSGNVGLVRFMINKKVPLFEYDHERRLPSCYAAMKGWVEILEVFYEAGDRFEGKPPGSWGLFETGFETPIKYAVQLGHQTTVRYLAQVGAPLDQVDREGFSPLYHAAQANQSAVIDILAEHGANFQALSKDGELPIERLSDIHWKQRFWGRYGMSACRDSYAFARLCYLSSFSHPDDRQYIEKTAEEKIILVVEKQVADQGWKRYADCIEIATGDASLQQAIEAHHYYGIIFYREVEGKIELVIAHRGTDLTSMPNLVADAQIMGREVPALFITATLPFIKKFLAQLSTKQGFIFKHKPVKSITHVGFSLGGFLAAAAAIKTPSLITFAKTFDAPGADFLVNSRESTIFSSRIINYVALPNLVNACNSHVGRVFQISCVPVDDGQHQQHDVTFQVPSKVLAGHFLETLNRHDLGQMIATNQKREMFYLRAVSKWPCAKIQLLYGPFPEKRDYRIGLIHATTRLLETLLSRTVWEAMQRETVSGKRIGLVAVKHSCDYRVEYANEDRQRAISQPSLAFLN